MRKLNVDFREFTFLKIYSSLKVLIKLPHQCNACKTVTYVFFLYVILLCFCCFRFTKGRIYTYIGEVVVSVNPYKSMNIYTPEYIKDYKGTLVP